MQFKYLYEQIMSSLIIEHSLPPDIFYYPNITVEPTLQALLLNKEGIKPALNDMVRRQILADIEAINNVDIGIPGRVDDFMIIGDCLRPLHQAQKNAPVEVVICYNVNNFSDLMHSRLLHLHSIIHGRLLSGTQRKVYYYFRHAPFDLDKYNAAYHPYTNKWIKEPKDFNINL